MAIDTKTQVVLKLNNQSIELMRRGDSPESSCQLPTTPAHNYLMQEKDYIESKERLIPLTQGKFSIVDEGDYDELIKHKWTLLRGKTVRYAYRSIRLRNPDETISISMHMQILNPPKGYEVDHKNHNGLDNRRCNIRICTRSQNSQNVRKAKRKSSKFKGVFESTQYKKLGYGKRWISAISKSDIIIYRGCFDSEIEAAKFYDAKALELFGEFAYTNF